MLQKTSHFLREANLIGGEWVQADSGVVIDVTNPANHQRIGGVPKCGGARNAPRHRGGRAGLCLLAQDLGAGALAAAAQAARRDHGQSRPAGRAPDTGAGQVADRIEGRGRFVRRLCLVVCRGRPAHLWRCRAEPLGRPPRAGHARAGRRDRRDHAVELSVLNARSQARPRTCRRLHGGRQTRVADALFWPCLGRSGRASRHSRRRGQHRDRVGQRDRRRAVRQPAGQEDHLHRLDRGRQDPAPEGVIDGEEGLDGARRQRALHRLRRCRSGPRRAGRDRSQIPQFRPDLRVHQSFLRAGGHL